MTVALKISFDERDETNQRMLNVQIDMLSIQPTIEYGLQDADVDFGAGGALDLYLGGFTTVSNWSFPLYVQYRSRNDEQWMPRIGTGLRLLPPFGQNDFRELGALNVNRSGWEFVWQGFGGVDYFGRK
jgi:hypothetical protein